MTIINFLSIPFRPYDVRIWQAQGMCYEEIGMCVASEFFRNGFQSANILLE